MSERHSHLGEAVREFRLKRRLSQEELGNMADLHRNYIGAIERGEINATFSTMLKVVHGLGMTLSELVLWAEEEAPAVHQQRAEHRQRSSRGRCTCGGKKRQR